MHPSPPQGSDAASRTVARLRIAIGLAALVMLVLSWPLWVENDAFPRVPFVSRLPQLSATASWTAFGLVLITIAAAAARIAWRASIAASLILLVGLVLEDQHRFQPWVYQYLMSGLLLATLPAPRAVRSLRWWFVALYFHSGLSKLDVAFCREMGPLFLTTAARPLGLDPSGWPRALQSVGTLAMPLWEIAVAVALAIPATRRIGLAGALVFHAVLLAILGPWGLRHSTIVLVWNAAMMVEAVIVFAPDVGGHEERRESVSWLGRFAQALFWLAAILPLTERWGGFDSWPAHALYASHVERTEVAIHEDELTRLPAPVRRHLVAGGPGPWLRLDLTGWSREARGVPVYPQGRACNGLAEALAARYGGRLSIRVIQWGRADRLTGRRDHVECLGPEAVRRQGDRYRLNAHPEGGFLHPNEAGTRASSRPDGA